jgi:hypothetical protein
MEKKLGKYTNILVSNCNSKWDQNFKQAYTLLYFPLLYSVIKLYNQNNINL